jgi:hypothetical protein
MGLGALRISTAGSGSEGVDFEPVGKAIVKNAAGHFEAHPTRALACSLVIAALGFASANGCTVGGGALPNGGKQPVNYTFDNGTEGWVLNKRASSANLGASWHGCSSDGRPAQRSPCPSRSRQGAAPWHWWVPPFGEPARPSAWQVSRTRAVDRTRPLRSLPVRAGAGARGHGLPDDPLLEGISPPAELSLGFDLRGRLVDVTTFRSQLPVEAASRAATEIAGSLVATLGAAPTATGSFDVEHLSRPAAWSIATRSYRYGDYVAGLTAMRAPSGGFAVREQHLSARD